MVTWVIRDWSRRRLVVWSVALGLVVSMAPVTRAADDGGTFSFEAGVDVAGRYAWRGLVLTDDPVVQPWVAVGAWGLTFTVWANADTTDVNGVEHDVSEIDYSLGYSHDIGKASLSVGVIYYDFPHTEFDSTTEANAAVAFDVPTQPSLTVNYDFDLIKGTYVSADIAPAFDFGQAAEHVTWGLELGAGLGYGDADYVAGYFLDAGSGLVDIHGRAAVPFAFGDHFSVTPSVGYMSVPDADLTAAAGLKSIYWGALGLSASF